MQSRNSAQDALEDIGVLRRLGDGTDVAVRLYERTGTDGSLGLKFYHRESAITLTEREPAFAVVYVDDIYHGELETLKSLRLEKILSVQYLPPFDAKTRFGQDMPGGAILIRTL